MIELDRIVPLRTGGPGTPLFCVHAVSGSPYSYLGLAELLGAERPVYGVEAPGFDDDREPVRSLPALSAEYVEMLRAFQPGGPFLLLGWSLGGTLAFDMAQRLAAAGERVPQVVMVDASIPWVAPLPPEREIVRRFLGDLLATIGAPTAAVGSWLDGQPEQADGTTLFAAAEQAGVLPDDLDSDLLTDRYPVFRAHLEALFGYEVTTPYDGAVTHLIASESPPHWMRWDGVAPRLTEHLVPGDHHSIWTGAALERLAELVRQSLPDGPGR